MKILLTIKFLLLVNLIFGQSNLDCERFKIGRFEITNPNGTHSLITRTKKEQIEKSGNVELKHKVKWIDQCTFKLYPIEINDETNVVGDDIVTFKIIETFEHAYLARVTMEGYKDFIIEVKVYELGYLDYDK